MAIETFNRIVSIRRFKHDPRVGYIHIDGEHYAYIRYLADDSVVMRKAVKGFDTVQEERRFSTLAQALKHIVDPTGWPGRPYGEHPTLIERGYNVAPQSLGGIIEGVVASGRARRGGGYE